MRVPQWESQLVVEDEEVVGIRLICATFVVLGVIPEPELSQMIDVAQVESTCGYLLIKSRGSSLINRQIEF